MSDRKEIPAEKAESGERVTLDFDEGGYGIGFIVDGKVFTPPNADGVATEAPDDLGSGLDDSFEGRTAYDVIQDGGNSYDEAYNLDTSGMNIREGSPAAKGL